MPVIAGCLLIFTGLMMELAGITSPPAFAFMGAIFGAISTLNVRVRL